MKYNTNMKLINSKFNHDNFFLRNGSQVCQVLTMSLRKKELRLQRAKYIHRNVHFRGNMHFLRLKKI